MSQEDLQFAVNHVDDGSLNESFQLLRKISELRKKHAETAFFESQRQYNEMVYGNDDDDDERIDTESSFHNKKKEKKEKKKVSANEFANDPFGDDLLTITAKTTEPGIELFPKKKKKKKWRKITIPEPFEFDRRERTKKKSIARRKLEEYFRELEEEEERHIKKRFQAEPIPKSTLQARFKELQLMREARSSEIKEMSKKWLIKTQRPFDFMKNEYEKKKDQNLKKLIDKYEFKPKPFRANPLPEDLHSKQMEKFLREDEARKINIARRARELFEKASLPPRMEEWKQNNEIAKKPRPEEYPHRPNVNLHVPDFGKLQKQFKDQLNAAKSSKELTKPEPFSFVSKDSHSSKEKILQEIEEDKRRLSEQRWPYLGSRLPVKPTTPNLTRPKFTPEKTRAVILREKKVKEFIEKLEQRRAREKFDEMQDSHRLAIVDAALEKHSPSLKPSKRKKSLQKKLKYRPRPHETKLKEEIKQKVLSEVQKTLSETNNQHLFDRIQEKLK